MALQHEDEGRVEAATEVLAAVHETAEECCAAPFWDVEFWDALEACEEVAAEALDALYMNACEGGGCSCRTCVTRTVLEAAMPAFTAATARAVEAASPAQTVGAASGGCCGGRCKRDR